MSGSKRMRKYEQKTRRFSIPKAIPERTRAVQEFKNGSRISSHNNDQSFVLNYKLYSSIVSVIMRVILSTRSDEPLSQIIRIIVYWFKVIGLAPFSLQQIKKSVKNSRTNYCTSVFRFSKIGFTYNILLAILFVVMGFFATPEILRACYPNTTALSRTVDLMQDTLRIATVCAIIVSWGFRQNKAVFVMNKLLEIDCLLSGMKTHPSSRRKSSIILTLYIIFNALLWVTFWATEEGFVHSSADMFVFNVPIFIMHWFVVQYSIVVGLVARKLDSLNDDLSSFRECPNFPMFESPSNQCPAVWQSSPNNYQLSALKLLHSIRTTLSEVAQDAATFFSFPILPVVACFSLSIVYNLNYLITPLVVTTGRIPVITGINVATWILVCLHSLVLLCYNVTETLTEARKTGPLVHKLLTVARKREIQTELERFSQELLHEDLSFTAWGLFSLDLTLIQSIFGATVTYLVIIIQFMQSAANTTKNT